MLLNAREDSEIVNGRANFVENHNNPSYYCCPVHYLLLLDNNNIVVNNLTDPSYIKVS